jgi:N-hydroxyarylamine O-acetyltransferase
VFDLDAYLERVGLTGHPTLAQLHRAHATSIPFENLDPHQGLAVSLELGDLQRKLVVQRRGGHCFEQNLLLKAALEAALDAEVELLLARVRVGMAAGEVRAPTHLVLRVHSEGTAWLADVGFGLGTLLEPLPFTPDGIQEQAGWRYQLVHDGRELVLRGAAGDEWAELYGFVPRPVPPIDLEMSNWYTSAHPESAFVTGIVVANQSADGTRRTLSDWGELAMRVQTPSSTTVTPMRQVDVPGALQTHFGLSGFSLGEDGRIVRAAADEENR